MSRFRFMFIAAITTACLSTLQGRGRADIMTITFSAPTNAPANPGAVRVALNNFLGGLEPSPPYPINTVGPNLRVNVAVDNTITAAQKATMIKNALIAANNSVNGPYGFTVNGATLTIDNSLTKPIGVAVNPRKTGEVQDQIVIQGTAPTTFPNGHGTMDPHAPTMSLFNDGTPNTFTAGVTVGGTDYTVTLSGSDPVFDGGTTVTGAQLATDLYDDLTSTYSSIPGVTLALVPGWQNGYSGDLAISAWFAAGTSDDGIIWGMSDTSETGDYGFIGSMADVPEPSTLIMLTMGALGMTPLVAAAVRRQRQSAAASARLRGRCS